MKWIKATDGHPENSDLVYLQQTARGLAFKLVGFYEPSTGHWHRQDGSYLLVIEGLLWLDESPAPADGWVRVETIEKAAEQMLLDWLKNEPTKLTMFMMIQMGKMAVEANAETLSITQESDIQKHRYEIKCEISTKKIAPLPQPPKPVTT